MATEGPLLKDGAQCVAAANYWNPASALDGPNGSGQFLAVYVSAARTVAAVATEGVAMYGILQNTPALGQAADVAIVGVSKMVAGAAITAGAELMTDANGRLIAWVGGSDYVKVGRALEAAGAANDIFTGIIYPAPVAGGLT
jgi:hypothetical protein